MNNLLFDVAIVGYGPVGAIAANLLGTYGIKTVVFERETHVYHLPRAIGFNHEIMRIFQQISLHHKIASVATSVDGVEFLNSAGKVLWEIEFGKTCLTHGFVPNYVFYQPDLETELRQGVERFKWVSVYLGHEVEEIAQNQQEIAVKVRHLSQQTSYQVRAKYVLGCDGARSITRQLAGLELHDFGFHQRQLVVDTLLTEEVALTSKVRQLCNPQRPGVFVPSTNNHRRWEFVLDRKETKTEMERPEKVRELLATYWLNPNKLEIIRAVVYSFHSLIALQWRKERVFIVGDAAHQMPPILGQGMCSGIRDAQNICWKLDLVLRGLASDKLLDTYQTERLPHVREIVRLATRAFKIFKTRNSIVALVRNTMLQIIRRFSSNDRFKNMGSDMPPLKQGILKSSPQGKQSVAGQMFIQPQVLTKTGELVLLDRVLGNNFAILGLNTDYFEVLTPQSRDFLANFSIKLVGIVPSVKSDRQQQLSSQIEIVEDTSQQIRDWLRYQQTEIVIIRPDRYIFGICDRDELNSTVAQLQSLLIDDYTITNEAPMVSDKPPIAMNYEL